MMLLWVAGIAVVLAGLAAVGFGIPVKEFGFGNTLILTGTIGVCTGLIMLSLAVVVRELKAFATGAGMDRFAEPTAEPAAVLPKREFEFPVPTGHEDDADDAAPVERPLFSRDQPAERGADAAPPPWQDEVTRDRERARSKAAPAADVEEEPEVKPRRNLLFSSSRREREAARAAEAPAIDHAIEQEPAMAAGQSAPPAAQPTFADGWPPVERMRPEPPRRAARAPSTFNEAAAEPVPERAAARAAEPEPVTVMKSGVVDGMAYSLYSDGSIEAQMPEGMMRFASIDDLREHLDQRG
jgi:hypothetical protein